MYYRDNQGMLAADLSVYWGNDFYLESSKGLVGELKTKTNKNQHEINVNWTVLEDLSKIKYT